MIDVHLASVVDQIIQQIRAHANLLLCILAGIRGALAPAWRRLRQLKLFRNIGGAPAMYDRRNFRLIVVIQINRFELIQINIKALNSALFRHATARQHIQSFH